VDFIAKAVSARCHPPSPKCHARGLLLDALQSEPATAGWSTHARRCSSSTSSAETRSTHSGRWAWRCGTRPACSITATIRYAGAVGGQVEHDSSLGGDAGLPRGIHQAPFAR